MIFIRNKIYKIVRTCIDLINIIRGFWHYQRTGITLPKTYQSLISLFCITKGKSNDLIHWFIKRKNPKIELNSYEGILGTKSLEDIQVIVKQLNQKGYAVFPNALNKEMLEYFTNFGFKQNASVRPMEASDHSKPRQKARVNLEKPLAIRYDFDEGLLVNDPVVQSLMADKSLLAVAQEYLGSAPYSDVTGMWWHTDFSDEPNPEAATMWHFDMDRVKWLKYFFYITDVTTETGPHCFVEGTHQTNGIPSKILKQGYARITDQEVSECFDKQQIIEFIAQKGTLIIEDTRGLHKGKAVIKGARLLFQTQFSDHLFGGTYEKKFISKYSNPTIQDFIEKNKSVYKRYL